MQIKEKNAIDTGIEKRDKLPIYFHIEADRVASGVSVSVMGVLAITDFCESCAIMKMRRGKIKVLGAELSVAVYENKTVEIYGKVSAVEFL